MGHGLAAEHVPLHGASFKQSSHPGDHASTETNGHTRGHCPSHVVVGRHHEGGPFRLCGLGDRTGDLRFVLEVLGHMQHLGGTSAAGATVCIQSTNGQRHHFSSALLGVGNRFKTGLGALSILGREVCQTLHVVVNSRVGVKGLWLLHAANARALLAGRQKSFCNLPWRVEAQTSPRSRLEARLQLAPRSGAWCAPP